MATSIKALAYSAGTGLCQRVSPSTRADERAVVRDEVPIDPQPVGEGRADWYILPVAMTTLTPTFPASTRAATVSSATERSASSNVSSKSIGDQAEDGSPTFHHHRLRRSS